MRKGARAKQHRDFSRWFYETAFPNSMDEDVASSVAGDTLAKRWRRIQNRKSVLSQFLVEKARSPHQQWDVGERAARTRGEADRFIQESGEGHCQLLERLARLLPSVT